MNWKLEDVPVFRAVVERGGITAAAELLGMPKSSVSKAVSRLERAIGVQLLERTTRSVRATTEGQSFYRQCQAIMERVEEADAQMSGFTAVPSGRLVVALPPAFCQEILGPRLAEFRRLHPQIELELVATSRPVDLFRDQIDVAIAVGVQPDSDLVQQSLLKGQLIWIASRGYLKKLRLGRTPKELMEHVQICEARYSSSPVVLKWRGLSISMEIGRGVMRVDDPLTVREAVAGGAGVSFLPDRYCTDHLTDGRLIRVAPDVEFELAVSSLSLITPRRRLPSARTKAFIEFVRSVCSNIGNR